MSLTSLYVYDKETKRIHRIGDERHDALYVINGEIRYHNLQNGDGGGVKDEDGCGYVILESEDGFLENEFGILDKRYEEEIKAYLGAPSPSSENEEPHPEEPLTEEEQFVEAVNDAIYPHSLNEAGELGAKKIAKRFGLAVAKEALEIGVQQYLRYDYAFGADVSTESVEKLLSKLGGIATNLRKSPEDAAMSHIVALARSSFFYWNNKKGWAILKSCIDKTNNVGLRRQALDDLLQITRTSENWSQWKSRVEEYAEMLEEKENG